MKSIEEPTKTFLTHICVQSTDQHVDLISTNSATIYGVSVDVSSLGINSASEHTIFSLIDAQYSTICIESLKCSKCKEGADCDKFLASKREALLGDDFLNEENIYR